MNVKHYRSGGTQTNEALPVVACERAANPCHSHAHGLWRRRWRRTRVVLPFRLQWRPGLPCNKFCWYEYPLTVPSMGNATGPISVTTLAGNAISSASFTVIVPNPLGNAAIRKIAPGYTHTCALLADDTVRCWGSNDFGQLGDGTTSPSSAAVSVAGVTNPVDIAVGTSFSCGIFGASSGASSGSVKCWGLGTSGQLGDNTNASSATPVPVSSVSTASQISARANHVCALLTSGQVVCWGEGTSGQLGNNSTSNSPVPVAVVGTGPDNYAVVNAQGQPASTKAFQVTAGDATLVQGSPPQMGRRAWESSAGARPTTASSAMARRFARSVRFAIPRVPTQFRSTSTD